LERFFFASFLKDCFGLKNLNHPILSLMESIILLHGAIGAQNQLEPLRDKLIALNYRVYLMSFSGHFKQPFQEDFSIKQFAFELSDFITKNQLVKPVVFGYSMGGYVALYLASQQIDLLGKIITLGTKFNWSPEIAAREIKMLNPTTIKEKVPIFAEALENRHGKEWVLLLNNTASMMVDLGNENLINKELLKLVSNEVLIGLADNDSMVTPEETLFFYESLKSAKRFNLPDSKHPIESVNLELLCKNIDQFIQGSYQ
jgi:esterase/lipase